ncbi:galactose oxidase, partial [Candidatus Poribacteria bacterium]|nr:galactose oxidase [Candidatus Poribacteria bacterium]
MIVWGGGPGNVPFFHTGGMCDPLADAWNPISVQNAPETRSFHTAVWTRNRMIVWGGYNGKNTLNTGGTYD